MDIIKTIYATFPFHFHALEKEMATHSSILAWRMPGMGEPGGLPSMGSHRVGHDWSDLAAATWYLNKICRLGGIFFKDLFMYLVLGFGCIGSLLLYMGFLSLWQAAAAAKSLQSCLTLCDPIDGSPPGSPVPGILQARTLE